MALSLSILDRKLLRDLWRVKGQALAIVLVIAAGISLFVMSNSMMVSLEETMHSYYKRYRFADIFAPTKRAPNYLLGEIRNLPGVTDAEGRINGGGLINLPGFSAPISARIISYTPESNSPINMVHLTAGRMISPEKPDEILLLESFALAHDITPGTYINATVNGVHRRFMVAGLALSPEFIYALPPGDFVVDASRFAAIWANRDTMEAAFDLGGSFNEVVLTITPNARNEALIDALDRLLAPYGATGAYTKADQISNKFLVEELAQLGTMSKVMPPIFVGVSIFLLNIVCTRLVQTEREQIGLAKSFGYSDLEVGLHYLKFVVIISVVGAVTGWLGGIWLGRMIGRIYQTYFHFPFFIYIANIKTLGISLVISLLAAAFGAFFAVRSAIRLTPAIAMRPPAPPQYSSGNGFLRSLSRILDQPSRMVMRRLIRQPVRSLLTALGIGAAMALSVMMRFNVNATDYMLEVSFNVIDRSDVLVTFVEPVSDKAILELSHIDGVEYAEPFRSAAVMFRHDRINFLGNITGMPDTRILNRAVDADLADVEITGAGIMLSRQLADILNISVGDVLEIEVREGQRPTLHIPVTGLIESLIGTPAYMEMGALNRQLREPDRVSGAYLKLDPDKRAEVYDRIKAIPLVAGVSLRREAYDNFSRMIDEGPGVFRYIMTVFSIIIAAGVVYNGARIAYVERQRDLASLRVLGFTNVETGYVLLGELVVLAIMAVPIGSLLGYLIWTYLATALSTELYQIPIIFREDGLGFAALIIFIATGLAGMLVQRDVQRINMATALKTRD